ncbi:MAG: asparaginyl-tRNA synthetase, partial [uncultured bacterium (gcode 4)]
MIDSIINMEVQQNMKNILVRDLFKNSAEYDGKEIQVSGWIRTSRASKTFGFIELNDGTYFKNVQVVFEETLANFDDIAKLSIASAIIIKGVFELTPDAKQPFEIKASEIVVEGYSTPDYPLQKKRHTMEYLRT